MTLLQGGKRWLGDGFVQEIHRRSFILASVLCCALFPFSLLFVAGGVLPAQYGWTASAIIMLYAAVTFLSELRATSLSVTSKRAVSILLLLSVIEFIGVNTGYPFGSYRYTDVLGLSFAGVPLAISFAWYATVMNTWRISEGLLSRLTPARPMLVAMSAGILTLALDIALEPMASTVNSYWLWSGNRIPLQNYASWFFLTSIAVYLLAMRGTAGGRQRRGLMRTAFLIYGMQVVLFVLTALRNGYVVPPLLTIGLLVFTFFAALLANSLVNHPSPQQE
jgi:bisanhydrobacterioruberin hydratase